MKETYLSECLEKFHELPDQIQEMVGGFDACSQIKKLEELYKVSLSFAVILVVIGELEIDDLPEYFNLKFNLDKSKAEELTNKLEEKIFDPVLDLVLEFNHNDDDSEEIKPSSIIEMSSADKKELILRTFTNNLIPALQAEPAKIKEFNIILFQVFNEDDLLEDKVENLLYNNQEKLSNHQIILDGHPASPSIANWLKDFIKKYGSNLFNEVTLAEYLSQSPNIKLLKPEEKDLVRKILKLYRNLVFFPESMDGVLIDNWEILPVDDSKIIEFAKQKNITENPVVTERQKTIFDLQKNLTKYPASSLEYKAISQEINRLSRK